jgi:hypothetical protein
MEGEGGRKEKSQGLKKVDKSLFHHCRDMGERERTGIGRQCDSALTTLDRPCFLLL